MIPIVQKGRWQEEGGRKEVFKKVANGSEAPPAGNAFDERDSAEDAWDKL